jgi:heme-degrading monooxygenase HmoA
VEPLAVGATDPAFSAVRAEERPARPAFSWSASRHDSFETCRRRYFFSYYAAHDDPEVRRLKRLSALPLWAGSVVHETIERFLRSHDALPSPSDQEAIGHAAVHEDMLAAWRQSEAGPAGFRLFEHEYAQPVDPEDKKILVHTVRRSLRNFFKSPTLREAFAAGRERWLTIEDLVSFHVGETEVFLRMDLAYRTPEGQVVIVDWKTGRGEGRFNEIQLAGYALYAAEKGWVSSPEEISTELAYLAVPRYVRRRVDPRKLAHARAFIEKSASRMRALLLDPRQNLARLEDFPMVDRPRVCRRCNFRRLCFPRPGEPWARPESAPALSP